MTRQWEVWKARPPGFETDHWFILLSNQERLDNPRLAHANGLACYTLRGEARKTEVRLDSADGFERPTVCQCDFLFVLEKAQLHSGLGPVSWERQQAIKSRIREVLRL